MTLILVRERKTIIRIGLNPALWLLYNTVDWNYFALRNICENSRKIWWKNFRYWKCFVKTHYYYNHYNYRVFMLLHVSRFLIFAKISSQTNSSLQYFTQVICSFSTHFNTLKPGFHIASQASQASQAIALYTETDLHVLWRHCLNRSYSSRSYHTDTFLSWSWSSHHSCCSSYKIQDSWRYYNSLKKVHQDEETLWRNCETVNL